MNKPALTTSLPPSSLAQWQPLTGALRSTRGRVTVRIGLVLLGSLFTALCAQVAVPLPWTPVPMTMQPFAVLLIGLLLGPALGASAMVAYLLEGAAGLPVFVPGFGGLLPLGPSAGYLLSYPFVAALAGLLWRRSSGFLPAVLAAAAGDALILLSGACWLAVVTRASFGTALHLGVLPFVAGDSIKVLLAAAIAAGCWRVGRFHAVDTAQAPE